MSDLTHHPQCSSVGGDACDCSGRVISTERPLDLARWRALADEAEESLHSIALLWQEMQAAMRRREPVHPNDIGNDPITVSAKAAELATALRAACDEVERLRGMSAAPVQQRYVCPQAKFGFHEILGGRVCGCGKPFGHEETEAP